MSRPPRRDLGIGGTRAPLPRGYHLRRSGDVYVIEWHDGKGALRIVARASERRFLAVPDERPRRRAGRRP